ncbi:replicative DNA helicase [Bounagaea algeriensis]
MASPDSPETLPPEPGGDNGPFDRQPPQDIPAEQSVLGGMMLSKDAIADVVEVVRPNDFYRPAHQAIYDCILDLYGRGEPADAVTVSHDLDRRQQLQKVGGAPYLHTLLATVPTAANAGYYAEIVAERAVLRRLVEAGTRVVQLGYQGGEGAEIDEVVDRAQAAVYDVTERRVNEDYAALEDLLQPTMDEIDAIASRGGQSQGIPSGFADLDDVTNGLHAGQMIIVAARPGVGKALALDTPLPTPGGWTTMGEAAVGEDLLGADGSPTRIVEATDVLTDRSCHRVEFSDGAAVTADAEHRWALDDERVVTTAELTRLADEAPVIAGRPGLKVTAVRPVGSVPVRCVQVDAPDRLYQAGPTGIPTHNSTLGLDFARAASIKHSMGSVIFSLEMGRTEIVMRMLSAEARIRLADMRGGSMSDEDWTRLARRMSEISEAPLFIDDSPNLTMMEIRAKARRLKQRHDIQLVVVDYMQLMTSGKKVESRQQEVSEFSRNLKLLAKELEIPVVAISQLNRGPEQRNDKKPQLADLRESGCLTGGTRLLRADTGAEVTFDELMRTGERPLVWSLDERMRLVPRLVTNVFSSGVKEAFRVRLSSGREIEATANHPMRTVDGWTPLGELGVGARVAVPRRTPEPVDAEPMPEPEVVLLAHLIGDGSYVRRQPIRYASVDEANLTAVTDAAQHFGVSAVRDEYAAAKVTTLRLPAPYRLTHGRRNPIAAWLDELGVFGQRSCDKHIPERVFRLPKEQIGLFLHHLWATDGSVRWDEKYGQGWIYYATTSRQLAEDVTQLLLRFGVFARIQTTNKVNYRACYHVSVYGSESQLTFLKEIGVHGMRALKADELEAQLLRIEQVPKADTVPSDVWEKVQPLLAAHGMSKHALCKAVNNNSYGARMFTVSPSRSRLGRVATELGDQELQDLTTSDVFWDEIVEVASLGEQPVYDATVEGTHNFIANCINMHNSLEQDADMVVLIHRPDAFERDDPRMGEADLMLAKHRAGPTSTVTVAHQLHYSRFVDMAQE